MSNESLVYLRSAGAPNGVGDYYWEDPDSIVAVDQETARGLIGIWGAGYSAAEQPKTKKEPTAPAVVLTPPADEKIEDNTVDPNQLGEALDLVAARPRGRPKKV